MTPEEARRMLELAAGADFVIHLDSDEAGPLLVEAGGAPLTVPELTLAAHAPDMATMIAGMREEWGVSLPDGRPVGAGWGTYDTALEDMNAWRRDGYDARIVRRYVTEPEEA